MHDVTKLFLEFCVGFHGNSDLVIWPAEAGDQLFEGVLDISEKKAPHVKLLKTMIEN